MLLCPLAIWAFALDGNLAKSYYTIEAKIHYSNVNYLLEYYLLNLFITTKPFETVIAERVARDIELASKARGRDNLNITHLSTEDFPTNPPGEIISTGAWAHMEIIRPPEHENIKRK